jgi:hypothetical protein
MTITITHEDGVTRTYENVVGIDFFDKSDCESIADRKLSDEELKDVEHAINSCEYFPTSIELLQIIEEVGR